MARSAHQLAVQVRDRQAALVCLGCHECVELMDEGTWTIPELSAADTQHRLDVARAEVAAYEAEEAACG